MGTFLVIILIGGFGFMCCYANRIVKKNKNKE